MCLKLWPFCRPLSHLLKGIYLSTRKHVLTKRNLDFWLLKAHLNPALTYDCHNQTSSFPQCQKWRQRAGGMSHASGQIRDKNGMREDYRMLSLVCPLFRMKSLKTDCAIWGTFGEKSFILTPRLLALNPVSFLFCFRLFNRHHQTKPLLSVSTSDLGAKCMCLCCWNSESWMKTSSDFSFCLFLSFMFLGFRWGLRFRSGFRFLICLKTSWEQPVGTTERCSSDPDVAKGSLNQKSREAKFTVLLSH